MLETYEEEQQKTLLELGKGALLDPRNAIRGVCRRNPALYFWYLIYFTGVISGLDGLAGKEVQNFGVTIIKILVVLPVIGVVGTYFGGWLLRFTGKLFNGQAKPEEMRAAILWSSVPNVVVMLLSFLITLAVKISFGSSSEELKGNMFAIVLIIAIPFIKGIIGIWTLINQARMVSEVQKISIWAATLSMVIPAALLITPLLIPMMVK